MPSCDAAHEKSDSDSEFEPFCGSDHEKSDSDSAAETDSTFFDVLSTMDTEKLVAYFGRASTCYTCSSTDYKINSASGSVFTVPIPHDARTALEDPTYGYSWRVATDAEIEGKFAADFAWEYVYKIVFGGVSAQKVGMFWNKLIPPKKPTV